ncbi:MAG TPA: homoserine kinase [Candidatus Dormibacteraeota bacterium]
MSRAEVVVPASSANLGCAFDCAALALDLQLEAEATVLSQGALEVHSYGEGAGTLPADASNLVVQGLQLIYQWAGQSAPGLRLRLDSSIPVGVGLGSSAAAIVAGLRLGAEMLGRRPGTATLLGMAADLDGHPDNVAAAWLGGLAVSATTRRGVLSRRVTVPEGLRFVLAVPDRTQPTAAARAVLPDTYSRADAVHNLQRACLLTAAAFAGDFDFEADFFDDRWHQARRADLLPGIRECLELERPDLLGVCLSGAGSSVLAIARREAADEVASELGRRFLDQGVQARTLILSADNRGARTRGRRPAGP